MIVNTHPVLKLLDESEWEFHLIGSRYVGVFDGDRSDYDFLVICDNWYKKDGLNDWLIANGFVTTDGKEGYGPDRSLCGTNVWTKKVDGYPNVDVLPVPPKEADFRLKFFKAMKKTGDSTGGLLAKALKQGRAWANLWAVLRRFDNEDL